MKKEQNDEQNLIKADDWVPAVLALTEKGKKIKIHPQGYSMYPFLASKRDEAVLMKPDREPRRGDVYLYRRTGGLHVLHRIHHIDENGGIYMLGDSQTWIEGPLLRSQLLAYMEGFVRKGKYISSDSKKYKFLYKTWMRIRPLRPAIIKTFQFFQRIAKKDEKTT